MADILAHPSAGEHFVRQRSCNDFLGLAESIVDSHPVLSTFAACEWDCLNDDGKLWIAAIIRETLARAEHVRGRHG